jgi:hypothetical protein
VIEISLQRATRVRTDASAPATCKPPAHAAKGRTPVRLPILPRTRAGCAIAFLAIALLATLAPAADTVPGVVIDHSPASSGIYIGSPSIAILPDGTLVASHDEFGPKSAYYTHAVTRLFRSTDAGKTWRPLTVLHDALWGGLFVHDGSLYWLGVRKEYGDLLIRRSGDGGATWTEPVDPLHGLIAAGHFHTAPVPVIEHAGRLWRAVEDADGPGGWGKCFRARMMSAPDNADLLNAASWTLTNPLPRDPGWLGGKFAGWLEGNAVVLPGGSVADMLRVDFVPAEGKAAVVRVSADGKIASFDNDFVDFPAGGKKFTVRFDPVSKLYWTLGNVILPADVNPDSGNTRNTVALLSSPDLRNWAVRSIVLHHHDRVRHGFQYLDWQFDGNDLIAVSRTAYDDAGGGADSSHDANYLTFHRITGFRSLGPAR